MQTPPYETRHPLISSRHTCPLGSDILGSPVLPSSLSWPLDESDCHQLVRKGRSNPKEPEGLSPPTTATRSGSQSAWTSLHDATGSQEKLRRAPTARTHACPISRGAACAARSPQEGGLREGEERAATTGKEEGQEGRSW